MIQQLEKKLDDYKLLRSSKTPNEELIEQAPTIRMVIKMVIDDLEPIIKDLKETISEQSKDFSTCENLLTEALDYMDNTHGYDTDLYREINKYFEN